MGKTVDLANLFIKTMVVFCFGSPELDSEPHTCLILVETVKFAGHRVALPSTRGMLGRLDSVRTARAQHPAAALFTCMCQQNAP